MIIVRNVFYVLGLMLGWGVVTGLHQEAHAQYQGCLSIQQIPRVECQALEALYDRTGGNFWLQNRGWKQSNQPCNWFGVTCEGANWPLNVTRIELRSNWLEGVIPGELANLPKLKVLILDNKGAAGFFPKLTGIMPSNLGVLDNLEVLSFTNNALVGGIPEEYTAMKSLRVLDLSINDFHDPIRPEIGNLTALEVLDLSNNQIRGVLPPELGELKALRQLILNDNQLVGPVPASLGTLPALEAFDASNNQLTGRLPASFAEVPMLFRLALENNPMTGALPLPIAQQATTLSSCQLAGTGMCLPDTPVYQPFGEEVCGLQQQSSCSYCEGLPENERVACEALDDLFNATNGLAWNQAGGWLAEPSLCAWDGVTCTASAITALNLEDNNLIGSLPETIGELQGLTRLNLSGNALTGSFPASLGNLTNLTELAITQTQLGGALPLRVAEVGLAATSCTLINNAPSLCVPNTPDYQALGAVSVCGLPLSDQCRVATLMPLARFSGQMNASAWVFEWTIAASAHPDRFELEQKSDAAFNVVATIPADDGQQSYSFRLPNAGLRAQTFRIKQVDANGAFLYSDELTLLPESARAIQLTSVFPNPAITQASLQFSVAETEYVAVRLYDTRGQEIRVLYEGAPAAQTTVDVSVSARDLAPGLYFVHLRGASFQATEPVVIVR